MMINHYNRLNNVKLILFITVLFSLLIYGCQQDPDAGLLTKNPVTGGTGVNLCSTDVLALDAHEPDNSTSDSGVAIANNGTISALYNIHNCGNSDFFNVAFPSTAWFSIKVVNVQDKLIAGLSLCISDTMCTLSNYLPIENTSTFITSYFKKNESKYLKIRSWNFTTGRYALQVKIHNTGTGLAIPSTLSDSEPANATIAGANGVAALVPDSEYFGGSIGVPSTIDAADIFKVTGLAVGSTYSFAFHTPVTNALLYFSFIDSDASNTLIKKVQPRNGRAFITYASSSTSDKYLGVSYVDSSVANAQVLSYRLAIIKDP